MVCSPSVFEAILLATACGVLVTSIAVKNVDLKLLGCLGEWNDITVALN